MIPLWFHPSFYFATANRVVLTIAMFCVAMIGCTSSHPTVFKPSTRGDGVWNDPTAPLKKQQDANRIDAIRKASQDQAQRLTEALTQQTLIDDPTLIQAPKVRWIRNTQSKTVAQTTRPKTINALTPPTPPISVAVKTQRVAPPSKVNKIPSKSFAQQWSGPKELDNRRSLLKRLRQSIRHSQDLASNKVLATIGLSLTDPDRKLQDADLEPLDPKKRQQYRHYQKIMLSLADQLISEDGKLDRDTIVDQIDQTMGKRPIQISKVDLCQRVRGFGVYDPFESHVFLAGREQPMIVYTEVTNFRSILTDANRHQVKLAQEVVLYNESDGLAVWRQPTVDIVDQSRNRRRDFFVVQMIRLPIRLSVGKYLLKVRITDISSGTLDESTIPIQFVVDQSLVAAGRK